MIEESEIVDSDFLVDHKSFRTGVAPGPFFPSEHLPSQLNNKL